MSTDVHVDGQAPHGNSNQQRPNRAETTSSRASYRGGRAMSTLDAAGNGDPIRDAIDAAGGNDALWCEMLVR
jgi:hypothetical protein